MKCMHCNKEIALVPSASERAARYGGTPASYTALFRVHADCAIIARNKATSDLIKGIK